MEVKCTNVLIHCETRVIHISNLL